MDRQAVINLLVSLKKEFLKDYDEASLRTDGELGVHNDYEQGKEDALRRITQELMKL